jgi:putative heme-binding domain-containing protein
MAALFSESYGTPMTSTSDSPLLDLTSGARRAQTFHEGFRQAPGVRNRSTPGIVYDLEIVAMRTPLSFVFCLTLSLFPAAAQEGQDRSKTLDQDLAEQNPYTSSSDVAIGRQYFLGHCAQCHGPEGEGGRGVNLTTGHYRHGSSDRQLYITIRQGVPGSEMPGSRLSQPEVWRMVAFVRRLGSAGAGEKATGDPSAGRMIYEGNGACAACHTVKEKGGRLGPDLTEIGLRRSLKFLRDSLTDPSSYIDQRYRSAIAVARDGTKIRGIVLNEDDYSIQMRDMREELHSFLKSDLAEVRHERESLMPSYKQSLSQREIENVVAYLSSLRGSE